jgi:hypothetical protein
MPNIITLNVTIDDIKKTGFFGNPKKCLLATALKRQLGSWTTISVSVKYAYINSRCYIIKEQFTPSDYESAIALRKPFTIQLIQWK